MSTRRKPPQRRVFTFCEKLVLGSISLPGHRSSILSSMNLAEISLSGLIAAAGATSGKHYVIPEGAPLKAYVDQDTELPVLPN